MTEIVEYLEGSLPALLLLLQGSDVQEIEVREAGVELRIHRSPLPAEQLALVETAEGDDVPPQEPRHAEIVAPLVGTFYRAGQEGMAPLAAEGTTVEPGTVVGIVESLQVLTDIESPYAGRVTKVLVTDGEPVEYGQTLFEVRLSD